MIGLAGIAIFFATLSLLIFMPPKKKADKLGWKPKAEITEAIESGALLVYRHSKFSWLYIGCFEDGKLYRVEGNIKTEELFQPDLFMITNIDREWTTKN